MQMTHWCPKDLRMFQGRMCMYWMDLSPRAMCVITGLTYVLSGNRNFFLLAAVKTMLKFCFPLRSRKG